MIDFLFKKRYHKILKRSSLVVIAHHKNELESNKYKGENMSINKVMIIGRLGQDPEMKTVGQNQTVTRLNVATGETWVDKSGQKQSRTDWHRIVVWGKLAENCAKYLAKGRQVYIEGKIQTRSWEDNGQKKYATEIVASVVQFLSSSEGGAEKSSSSSSNKKQTTNKKANTKMEDSSDSGEDSFSESDYNFDDFGPEPSTTGDDGKGSGDIPF